MGWLRQVPDPADLVQFLSVGMNLLTSFDQPELVARLTELVSQLGGFDVTIKKLESVEILERSLKKAGGHGRKAQNRSLVPEQFIIATWSTPCEQCDSTPRHVTRGVTPCDATPRHAM